MDGDPSLPQRFAARVAGELDTNESIVWVGQPAGKMPPRRMRSVVVFAVILTGAVVFTVLAVLGEGLLPRIVFGVGAGVWWLFFAVALMLPAILRAAARNTYYVLTNRRVMICYRKFDTPGLKLKTYRPAELAHMTCVEENDGTGTITLAADTKPPGAWADGLHGIDKVREVETLIRETLRL